MSDWYPWFPVLFRSDTLHLTIAQDGIYRRLIDHYMETRRPLPDHDQALAAVARIGLDEWLEHAPVIREFFSQKKGVLHHRRCDRELDVQDKRSHTRGQIAQKGALERWRRHKRLDASSMLKPCFQHATGQDKTVSKKDTTDLNPPAVDIQTNTEPSRESGVRARDREAELKPTTKLQERKTHGKGSRLPEDWGLPGEWRLAARATHNWTEERCDRIADRFKRYWTSPDCQHPLKRDWRRTWENWCDRAADAGEGANRGYQNGQAGGGASRPRGLGEMAAEYAASAIRARAAG